MHAYPGPQCGAVLGCRLANQAGSGLLHGPPTSGATSAREAETEGADALCAGDWGAAPSARDAAEGGTRENTDSVTASATRARGSAADFLMIRILLDDVLAGG